MGKLHEAGDYVATGGLVFGITPSILLFIGAASAQKRGDSFATEQLGDTAMWLGGAGLAVLVLGLGMMWLGNRKPS